MPGFSAVASRRALSAATLLIFGGGLALYQMTSLWLGPAGSREFHLSLAIPAVEDELSQPGTSDFNFALGTWIGPTSPAPASAHRPTSPPAAQVKVGFQPPASFSHPTAPVVGLTGRTANLRHGDDAD